jgi:hypothetical protein
MAAIPNYPANRLQSLFTQGMENNMLTFGLFFETCLACVLS